MQIVVWSKLINITKNYVQSKCGVLFLSEPVNLIASSWFHSFGNIAERNIEIALECGFTTNQLLKYDVVHSPLLFKGEGMMTKPEKKPFTQGAGDSSQTWGLLL